MRRDEVFSRLDAACAAHARAVDRALRTAVLRMALTARSGEMTAEQIRARLASSFSSLSPMLVVRSAAFWADAGIPARRGSSVTESVEEAWRTDKPRRWEGSRGTLWLRAFVSPPRILRALEGLEAERVVARLQVEGREAWHWVSPFEGSPTPVQAREQALRRIAARAAGPEASPEAVERLAAFADASRGVLLRFSSLDGGLRLPRGWHGVVFPHRVAWERGGFFLRACSFMLVSPWGEVRHGSMKGMRRPIESRPGAGLQGMSVVFPSPSRAFSRARHFVDSAVFLPATDLSRTMRAPLGSPRVTFSGGGRAVCDFLGMPRDRAGSVANALRHHPGKQGKPDDAAVGRVLRAAAARHPFGEAVSAVHRLTARGWAFLFPDQDAETIPGFLWTPRGVAGERRRQFVFLHPMFAQAVVNPDPSGARLIAMIDGAEPVMEELSRRSGIPRATLRRVARTPWQRGVFRPNDPHRPIASSCEETGRHTALSMMSRFLLDVGPTPNVAGSTHTPAPDADASAPAPARLVRRLGEPGERLRAFLALAPLQALPETRAQWTLLCSLLALEKKWAEQGCLVSGHSPHTPMVLRSLRRLRFDWSALAGEISGDARELPVAHDAVAWASQRLTAALMSVSDGRTWDENTTASLVALLGTPERADFRSYARVSRAWHAGTERFEAEILRIRFPDQDVRPEASRWEPLTEEAEFALPRGGHARWLLSAKALAEEGAEMGHCVGGYAANCLYARSHILAMRHGGGTRTTLEIRLEREDGKAGEKGGAPSWKPRLIQHHGPGNAPPSSAEEASARAALALVAQCLEKGRGDRLEQALDERVKARPPSAHRYEGPRDYRLTPEQGRAVLDLLRPLLAPGNRGKSLEDLLAQVQALSPEPTRKRLPSNDEAELECLF